ncbi:MAG: DUF2141 domain-containing protein [Cyclobacteriaceae bacterium]
MDKRIVLVFCILLSLTRFYSFGQGGELTVTVMDIAPGAGQIHVALYDSEAKFLKEHVYSQSINADSSSNEVRFSDLKEGEYAICVIHDENENGELDKNFFGIPKEGFGFLNGVMGRYGPPKYDEVKIRWTGESQKVVVPLRYY